MPDCFANRGSTLSMCDANDSFKSTYIHKYLQTGCFYVSFYIEGQRTGRLNIHLHSFIHINYQFIGINQIFQCTDALKNQNVCLPKEVT